MSELFSGAGYALAVIAVFIVLPASLLVGLYATVNFGVKFFVSRNS